MLGLMQHQSLLISSLIDHAARNHPDREIVSRSADGQVHRSSYGQVQRCAKRMANALTTLGVKPGERVAALAWNGYRHMELYYAVSGMGAVLHTINPRLFAEQIEYIVTHADDQYLFFDIGFAGIIEKLAPMMKTVKGFVAMTDRANMPPLAIPNLLCYEELADAACDEFAWPEFDENSAASLCYTSGTTGNPNGVLYSHRSSVLHAMAVCGVDGLGLSGADSTLVVVPMFHVNAWGMPYAGALCGAKLVFPGAALDGKSVYELMRDERVTLALGVPTVWMGLFRHIEGAQCDPLRELCLERCVIGGAAAPLSMIEQFEQRFGATVIHAWGMTEMSPLGTVCRLLPEHRQLPAGQRHRLQAKQGRAVFGVSLKITDEQGCCLPHDGKAFGHLMVRGPWIAASYYGGEGGNLLDADGYFDTGDVATIDADGYMQITDRSKDVIKSGGEWISSIELEHAAQGHPSVDEAAVIGVAHPIWQERPLLIVVLKAGHALTGNALLEHMAANVAKWSLPDDVVFVEQLPHTATGKLQKMRLREQFREHLLPNQIRRPGAGGNPWAAK
ncbi:MAG: 3-(methylthio)propionyl-CoA ligase [Pseudomonadota bacterium]